MKFGEYELNRDIKLTMILGLLSIAMELIVRLFVKTKYHFPWEEIPGFYAFFGFFGCILLSAFSKLLGKKILMKEPDYYEKR